MISVHPLRPGAAERHDEWCRQLRRRRDEFALSRRAVGVTRQAFWLQPDHELVVVRTDADDPLHALRRLRDATDRFDLWYRRQELAVHGTALVDAGDPPELLTDDRSGEVGADDLFVAWAVPLAPGRTGAYRDGIATGDGLDRTRRWGLKRMAIWLQHVAGRDVVVHELAGDIPAMVRRLTQDQDPEIHRQREFLRESFAIELYGGNVPLPVPTFAWSAIRARTGAR